MTPRRKSKAQEERRRNMALRELLDELVDHVRNVAANARALPQEDLEYAQDRLEWLADEIWQKVLDHPPDE
jgi:hypothetical protein